jgi:hypothetical protein
VGGGLVVHRTPVARQKTNHPAPTWYRADMPTIFTEIQTRLALRESEVEQLRRRFRSLPGDHPGRDALRRQLEIGAAVAGELESLLELVGRGAVRSPYAVVES